MIDFVIPCHPKDFPSLKLTVDGIKNNIACCNRVIVISRDEPRNIDTTYIPEENFDSFITLNKIIHVWNEKNPKLEYRSKWIYQQLIKLLTVKVVPDLTESFVIVDADTIFLRNVNFNADKFYYSISKEYHEPYVNVIRRLLNTNNTIGYSTIAHHCIMNVNIVHEMINNIESHFCESFVNVIMNNIDYNEASCLSEWDLYANYMILNRPEMCQQRQLSWTDIPFIPEAHHLNELSKTYDFVSCHAYMRGVE